MALGPGPFKLRLVVPHAEDTLSVALSIDKRNATDLEARHYHSSESHLHSGLRGSILGALDMAQSHEK